jgi:hypothetical protein
VRFHLSVAHSGIPSILAPAHSAAVGTCSSWRFSFRAVPIATALVAVGMCQAGRVIMRSGRFVHAQFAKHVDELA